jgi:hypothetical protein
VAASIERPTDELREVGTKHLRYEVRMLVCHARLLRRYAGGIPKDDVMGFPHPAWDAILEAWLVHARVLDEFFRHTRPEKGSACARQWLKQWKGRVLDNPESKAIERQVVHFGAKRRSPHEWDIDGITRRACQTMVRFAEDVRVKRDEARYETIREAREFAQRFLDGNLAATDCAREAVTFDP